MASWAYLKDGAGILPASNMADTLGGSDLTTTDVLVREAVQNSLDERRSDINRPVTVRFERRTLTGEDKRKFVDSLSLGELSERRTSFTQSLDWFSDGNAVLDAIDDPTVPFPVLIISDFDANGLGGRWNRRSSKDDRFFNLVLSIGGSLKWEDEDNADTGRKLGSYGYGKMAFAMCSDIRVVAYYSTFDSDDGSEGVRCRAMATAFLPPHTQDDIDYAGQAYFGDDSGEDRIPRKPLADQKAHEWAGTLGLTQRKEERTGVTIVIPAARSSIGEIVECCEKWWWPRMRDPEPLRRVVFEFVDDDNAARKCHPRSRPGLSHVMDCFKLIPSGLSGDGYINHAVTVIPEGQRRAAGQLVLKSIQSSIDADSHGEFTNSIALVRDGLVIRYESRFAHEDKPAVAGVFVPSSDFDIHQALVLSEPPSHDDWVENAERLRGQYKWAREFIRLMKNRIRNLTRDFQTSQAPLHESASTNSAAFLRKALGPLFGSPKNRTPRPPVPPHPQRRAFTISTRQSGRRSRTNGGDQEDYAIFRIGLSEHAPKEVVIVDVVVSLKALADVDASPTDAIPCQVVTPHGVFSEKKETTFTTELGPGKEIDIEACGQVHPHWKTQWEVSISRTVDQQ